MPGKSVATTVKMVLSCYQYHGRDIHYSRK